MVNTDFDFSGDEWFDDEVITWNTERKRQYQFELLHSTVMKFIFISVYFQISPQASNL